MHGPQYGCNEVSGCDHPRFQSFGRRRHSVRGRRETPYSQPRCRAWDTAFWRLILSPLSPTPFFKEVAGEARGRDSLDGDAFGVLGQWAQWGSGRVSPRRGGPRPNRALPAPRRAQGSAEDPPPDGQIHPHHPKAAMDATFRCRIPKFMPS